MPRACLAGRDIDAFESKLPRACAKSGTENANQGTENVKSGTENAKSGTENANQGAEKANANTRSITVRTQATVRGACGLSVAKSG
jgi:hypothetical protein